MARLEMTSLTFMLVCVPLPVCQMRKGNWSLSLPAMTSSAAWTMSLAFSAGKLAQILIHQGAGLFQDAEGADQLGRHGVAADVEMQQRTLGLRAPVDVGWDLDLAHAVGFGAGANRRSAGVAMVCPRCKWVRATADYSSDSRGCAATTGRTWRARYPGRESDRVLEF